MIQQAALIVRSAPPFETRAFGAAPQGEVGVVTSRHRALSLRLADPWASVAMIPFRGH